MTENTQPTTRKELMRPAQLLLIAAVCGVFAGGVTAVSLGAFQDRATPGLDEAAHEVARQATVSNAVILGLVAAGIAFIAVLLIMSLLLLAVKPEDVTKTIDRPVLLPDAAPAEASVPAGGAAGGAGVGAGAGAAAGVAAGAGEAAPASADEASSADKPAAS